MEWSWLILLLIPIAWIVQNTIHEASHLLVGWWREGRKPIALIPYPHKYNGLFYFARYTCSAGSKKDPEDLTDIAPFWAGFIWLDLQACLMYLTDSFWPLPFAVAGLIDALFFWWGYFWGSSSCDGKRYRHRMNRGEYQNG